MANESTAVNELLASFHKLHRLKERVKKEASKMRLDQPPLAELRQKAPKGGAADRLKHLIRCVEDLTNPTSLYNDMCQATYNMIQCCDDIFQIASKSRHAELMKLAEIVSVRADGIAEIVFEAGIE